MDDVNTFKTYKNDWTYPIYVRNPYGSTGRVYIGKRVTFQEALKVTLVTGQCFGLNPVLGICEPDAAKLRFTCSSWRFVYTMLSIVMQCACVLLCFMKMLMDTNTSLDSNTSTIFHLTTCVTTIIFLRIATKWPKICVQISRTEAADPNMDPTLIRKCNLACLIILTLAVHKFNLVGYKTIGTNVNLHLVEHALADISGIAVAVECFSQQDVYEAFIVHSFPWWYAFIPYNVFIGIVSQFLNVQCTFNWNFADLFVICMSMYLTSRLDQVNQRINAVRGKYVPTSFWRTMREDYNRVTWLVRLVDEIIGGVVFISFANNLFFICLQLLHTLAPFRGYEQAVYFVFSFSFLVLRSLAVSLAASRVHTASKAPARALYDVSSATYCVEIQRLLDQIHGDTVSLSGLQFFNVKRGLVLSIAGTIVTYELVLMQFTGVSPTSTPPT